MTTLEVNTNNEWLQVFSSIDFDEIEECDQDYAATDFTNTLISKLEDAGFEVERAKGQRATCHGWNGANTFQEMIGPVGTFDNLSEAESEAIYDCIEAANAEMLRTWHEMAD